MKMLFFSKKLWGCCVIFYILCVWSVSFASEPIRYVVIGDSYTIGAPGTPEESWPVKLTQRLQKDGTDIVLVANPARSGWTLMDALNKEMPIYRDHRPTFATVLIGTNDISRKMNEQDFKYHFTQLIDEMLAVLPSEKHLLIIGNPDFSFTRFVQIYQKRYNFDIQRRVKRLNRIIQDVAKDKGVVYFDLYALSQTLKNDPDYISHDGFHPSAKGYDAWAQAFYPVVKNMILKLQQQ